MLAILVQMMAAKNLDISLYERTYFYWDKVVEYPLSDDITINIYPIMLADSEIFLNCAQLFAVNKNEIADAAIIQMSYLQFMTDKLLTDETNALRFVMLCKLCLHRQFNIESDEYGRCRLVSIEPNDGVIISSKKFDDIRSIILHQNLIDYDDDYTNPELKAALDEMKKLKGQNLEDISIERKIAIITAHTGINKQQQLQMSLREHSLLFREVCGEVDFDNTWLVALYSGEAKNLDHWIFRKKHGKLDGQIYAADKFAESAGMSVSKI